MKHATMEARRSAPGPRFWRDPAERNQLTLPQELRLVGEAQSGIYHLSWRPVPGALQYDVELEFLTIHGWSRLESWIDLPGTDMMHFPNLRRPKLRFRVRAYNRRMESHWSPWCFGEQHSGEEALS